MEERKRPAVGSADELAPPSKRVAVNGSKPKDDGLEMKEESWVEVRATHRAPFCRVLEPDAHRPPFTDFSRFQFPHRGVPFRGYP